MHLAAMTLDSETGIHLAAEGDISMDSAISTKETRAYEHRSGGLFGRNHTKENRQYEEKVTETQIATQGEFTISSKGDVVMVADVAVSQNVSISAGGDFLLSSTVAENRSLESQSSSGLMHAHSKKEMLIDQRVQKSDLSVGGALLVHSDGRILLQGAKIEADESIRLGAKEGVYAITVTEEDYSVKEERSSGFLSSSRHLKREWEQKKTATDLSSNP